MGDVEDIVSDLEGQPDGPAEIPQTLEFSVGASGVDAARNQAGGNQRAGLRAVDVFERSRIRHLPLGLQVLDLAACRRMALERQPAIAAAQASLAAAQARACSLQKLHAIPLVASDLPMIDALLNRPEFAGVHKQASSKGNGIAALARGDGDMALQLVCEILDRPETELVGALPAELNASIDADAAVLSGAPHPKEAAAYLSYITQPESAAIWASKGLVRQ